MFDGISRKYDFLNHFLSLGRDIRWRKRAVKQLPAGTESILDLCGGTGDFLMEAQKVLPQAKGVVADFSFGMLAVCRKKFPETPTLQLDAMKTPLGSETFHSALNAFGMRNLDCTQTGIKEANRILTPGGYFITLEFFKPSNPISFVFYKILAPAFIPIFGAFFSGRKSAYEYLVRSIRGFLTVADYGKLCEDSGFHVKKIGVCDFGIAHIVVCQKK
jgi:demethylmenaquinone methyltransferase/2-methoxy-6-polyprenyl-1,4-benzoquinol methylase